MTEPDDQQWSRRRLRDEASDRAAQNDSASDGTDSDAETDGPRATPLSPRGAAEPLSYITQERGSAAGGSFRPRRDDDQLPPTEAIEQVDAPAYRVRDFSPEGRSGVPSWAPAYTQTRNPFASTADQAAQGAADEHGELDYQTARRDEVPAPAASTEGSEPPPITESIPIYNGERTMTRRELRALREAKAAEAAAAGRPAPEIFVTSITGVPQERPGADDAEYIETAEAAPAGETAAEPAGDAEAAPIDRPVTERPEWAPVFSDAPSGADAVVDEAAVESDADETTAADQAATPAETTAEAEPDAAAETEADERDEAETAERADVIEPDAEPVEAEQSEPESVEPAAAEPAPASPFEAAPPRPVDLIEPPEPARWSPEGGDASVFDQLLSTGGGEGAPQSPYATSAPSIDELLFGAPTPPPARESEAEPADAEQAEAEQAGSFDAAPAPVDDDAAPAAEQTEVVEADAEPEVVAAETETVIESEPEPAADLAAEPAEAEADAADPVEVAAATEPVADDSADESGAEPAEEPTADEPVAEGADAGAPEEPALPSLSDLPPPNADPAEPNGDPNSYLGAAPSLADRVDMPAPPSWRAPEPPEQDAPAAEAEAETDEHDAAPVLADADAEEIVVDEAPADEPVEAHPVVVDVTPLPAEPLPDAPATSADPVALHWSNQDEDEHGDFVASRDVIGGHGVVTTNALVLPSIPQPEFGTPLATTGEIIITGSIDLPRSLSSTGAHPTQLDESALDHELDPGDHQVASTDSQPVRAIRAVSTHTSTRGMMSNPKPRGNRTLTVLIIASAGLAVLVAGVLIFGIVTNQF